MAIQTADLKNGEVRTLYHWSRTDGQIRAYTVRWISALECWREDWPNGYAQFSNAWMHATSEEAREHARMHFLNERARVDDALARLAGA